MAAVAPLRIYYTPTAVLTHTALLCAPRARVCVSVYARARVYLYACVRACVNGDRVVCVCIMLSCRTLRARAAQTGRRSGRHAAKRPAPRPTVCDGSPPRETQPKRASDVRRSPRRRRSQSVGRACNCRGRAHFRHPWTAARGSLGDSCRRRAVLYRWRRRAPAGLPPPPGISPVPRVYYIHAAETSSVRA